MPFAFKVCGLGLATVLVLVMLVAAELSMRLLMVASQLASKRSYEELARHSLGRLGQLAVEFSVIANNVGSLVRGRSSYVPCPPHWHHQRVCCRLCSLRVLLPWLWPVP